MAKKAEKTIGGWAFVIGFILAIILAIFGTNQTWPMYVLLVLGLIVGIMNITSKEVTPFLVAAIAFMGTFKVFEELFGGIPTVGPKIATFFLLIASFVAPAAAVVAFKALFAYSRD